MKTYTYDAKIPTYKQLENLGFRIAAARGLEHPSVEIHIENGAGQASSGVFHFWGFNLYVSDGLAGMYEDHIFAVTPNDIDAALGLFTVMIEYNPQPYYAESRPASSSIAEYLSTPVFDVDQYLQDIANFHSSS